jgi:peptide/nickel transport system substrate-binding protein
MFQKRLMFVLGLLVAMSMLLTACGPKPTPVATQPAATAGPTAAPQTTRHGGWLDEIDVSVVAPGSEISQIQAGAIDIYSFGLAPSEAKAVKDSGLGYAQSYSTYYGIMMNPAVFKDTTVLNPFSDRKIREALNWLIDRNYVNQEIYGGGALPKLTPLTTQLVDYTGVIDVARALETKYAYNLDKGKEVISTEMTSLGATMGADGKWQFGGKPVTLIFLIRSDGDGTRKPMGDYVSTQLENVGFTVDRQYKKSSEASPIWRGSDPVDGEWNMYTAGWGSPGLTRDEKSIFDQMYLPDSIQGEQVFYANKDPDPEFQKLGTALDHGDFTTVEERHDMIVQALPLAIQDSVQAWVVDTLHYYPFKKGVVVTYDLASGFESAVMGGYNLRWADKEGGTMKVGTTDLFTDPWNPVAGDNWVWDDFIMQATSSYGVMSDPYTGLAWPMRIETAEVTAQTGLPVATNLDWVTLKTADTIEVPDDAWAGWDAKTQTWISAKDRAAAAAADPSGPDGAYAQTAKIKSVVTFPADLYTTVKWHDGSPFSVADVIMPQIMYWDLCSPDSAIYDESMVATCDSARPAFKGWRITSTDPLTVEFYTDNFQSDAELDVLDPWPTASWGLKGHENSWHVLAIGNAAQAAGELAYSTDLADSRKVEYMSFIGGPSLDILSKHLDEAESQSLVPYAPTLGKYITADEAKARYDNLKKWYTDHGHFWVGTGPYYLDKAFTTEKNAVLKNNTDFPDLADRWSSFSTPKLATAALDGPAQVKVGDSATFDVSVTLEDGSTYANSDVKQVKYILYDATNTVVAVGDATAAGDGKYQVVLGPDITGKLVAGSDKLEVAVVPIPVAIPAFTSINFVVVP